MNRAITSLAQYEDRLRAVLGLVGEIGLQLRPDQYTPIVIAGNADVPGAATVRGRRFACSYFASSIIVQTAFKFKFASKVWLERVALSYTAITAATPPTIRSLSTAVVAADLAATYAALSSSGWREGPYESDGPPLLFASNGSTGIGKVLYHAGETAAANAGQFPLQDLGLEVGQALCIQAENSTTNLVINIEGRIF